MEFFRIRTPEDMKEDVEEAISKLEKIIDEIGDNAYLEGMSVRAKEMLDNAERCIKFNLWRRHMANDWTAIETVGTIDQGVYGNRVTFDPPRELLRVDFPTGAHIFGGDREYYRKFIHEIMEKTKPDYLCWGFGVLFYEPQNARDAVETIIEIKEKYISRADERKKEYKIEQLEMEREKLEREIANLKEGKR